MTAIAAQSSTRAIVVEELLPHRPEVVWEVLTRSDLMARWLMKNDFAPVAGREFIMQARPMGDWDGTVRCTVTKCEPPRVLSYTWIGGSTTNPRYGAALDSTVTWTLTPTEGGTRVRMVHDGFRSPENDMAFTEMGKGWGTVLGRIGALAAELG